MLLLNLLVKPVWIFFIDRNVQLRVGHDEYGLYGALAGLTIILNILLDMGITSYNNKSLSADTKLIESKLPNMIVAKGVLSAIYFIIVIIVAFILQYSGRAIYLVFLLAVVQMLNSFLLFLRSNVSANHHFKTDSLLSVLDKVLMVALCGFLLFSPVFQHEFIIEWFIYSQIVAYLIAVIVALVLITKRYSRIYFSHFSIPEVIAVCKKSLPFAILILLMAIYMRCDTLILERMEGAEQNSIYLEAYRILDAVNMIAFLFSGILLPMFSRMLAQKLNIENLLITTVNIIVTASLALVAFCIVYSGNIMSLLYPASDNGLKLIFSFVIGSFPAYCIMYVYSTLLTANGNISLLIRIALGGSLLSVLLNIILIHHFHALGAAVTCFSVQWLLAGTYILFSIKKINLPVRYKRIVKFITVFLLMLLLNLGLNYYNVMLGYAILYNLVVFILTVYSIGLWDKKIIDSYFKQYKAID